PDADRRQSDGDDHGARHALRGLRDRQRREAVVMTATVLRSTSRAGESRLVPSPLPSPAQLRLEQTPMHELEKIFVRGVQPNLDDLVGWEFRGINHLPLNRLPVANLLGIKKFVKGFFRTEDGRVKIGRASCRERV